jgi:hypothetical protein
MIDKVTTFTLNLIKSNVSIVLIFYASGFLSFIAYNRVLGIPYIVGDLQTYAEMAGKNIIVILQTFIFLVTKPYYLISIFDDLSWAGFTIYLWLIVASVLVIIRLIFKLFPQTIIIRIQENPYATRMQLGLITIAVITTFHIETQSFHADNVLQPTDFPAFYQQKKNLINYEQQTQKIDYQRRVKIFNQFNSNSDMDNKADFIKTFFFSIPENYDESGNDKRRLNALMLIILIVSITAVILFNYRQHSLIRWLLFFFAFAQAILIPFNYGVLGTKYQYPVVFLDYTEKDKQTHKEGVYLLAKSQDNLVIYDRLNFFKISYIPQSSVINLEQVFTSSPFSNCSNGDFKPCELYAIKQSSD